MARTTSTPGCEAITFAKALQPLESARQIKENSKTYQNLQDESHISKAYTDNCCTNTDIQNEKSITKKQNHAH